MSLDGQSGFSQTHFSKTQLRSPVDVQKLRVYRQEQLLSLSRISLGVEVVQKSLSRISLGVEVVQKSLSRISLGVEVVQKFVLRQLTKKNGGALSRWLMCLSEWMGLRLDKSEVCNWTNPVNYQ